MAVIGMHRGGTSAVARGVKALGVEFGNRMMPPSAAANPKGFWEDVDLSALNERVLKTAGCPSWRGVGSIDPGVWDSPSVERLKAEAAALVDAKFGGCALWGFKDPRAARLLPFWKDVFRRLGLECCYVLVVRNPVSVARSLGVRNAMPAEWSHLLWLRHMLPASLDTAGSRRVVVDYDLLMASPERQIERVAAGLEIALSGPARAEIRDYARNFLSEEHRHTVFGAGDVPGDSAVLSLVRGVFEWLDRLSRDTVPLDDPATAGALREVAARLEALAPLCRIVDDLESACAASRRELAETRGATGTLRRELARAQRARDEAAAALADLRRSGSWRVTAPLRQVRGAARALLALLRGSDGGGGPTAAS